MKRAPRSRQRHDLYAKYHDYDSEISDLLGECGFDILSAGGKAGQFELPDMARYLPSMGPAAAAAGFNGQKGLTDLVSMLQIMRKGSGTSEEAATSMLNIFQKMFSEETTKRFKKFGVDLPKAMEKGRKEGRNLVEVFEDLTDKALKGDLSKLPQLINDMEFSRGIRALLTYRGEWQKLSTVIGKTAPGSVANDLARVTNDAQGKIDKLANMGSRRLRKMGELLFDALNPLDEAVKRIEAGENSTVNAINAASKKYVNDLIARQEMNGGPQYEQSADDRREIEARKAFLARQQYDDKVSAFDTEIARYEKVLQGRPVRNARLFAEGRIKELSEARAALVGSQRAVDELQVRMAENEAAKKRSRTRMGPGVSGTPVPITPGIMSFGFGPHGSNRPPEPGETIAPLPPSRPADLPGAAKMLERFEHVFQSGVEISASSVQALREPSGTQDVRVTNPSPAPIITNNVTVTVTTNASPGEIGAAAARAVGQATKRGLEGAISDAAN